MTGSIVITAHRAGRSRKPEYVILLRSLYDSELEHQAVAAKARRKLRGCGYRVEEESDGRIYL